MQRGRGPSGRGGGRAGRDGGGDGTFRTGPGFASALLQVLNTLDTRTSAFKAHRVVRAVYINRDSSVEALTSPKPAHGEHLPLPPLGAASPAAPGFPACPAPRFLPLLGHGQLWTPRFHRAQPPEFTRAGRAAPGEERTADVQFSSRRLAGVGAQPLPV